ncbi:MAG: hypothetical protein Kow00109_09580 [Acidobacteriota bacterium]
MSGGQIAVLPKEGGVMYRLPVRGNRFAYSLAFVAGSVGLILLFLPGVAFGEDESGPVFLVRFWQVLGTASLLVAVAATRLRTEVILLRNQGLLKVREVCCGKFGVASTFPLRPDGALTIQLHRLQPSGRSGMPGRCFGYLQLRGEDRTSTPIAFGYSCRVLEELAHYLAGELPGARLVSEPGPAFAQREVSAAATVAPPPETWPRGVQVQRLGDRTLVRLTRAGWLRLPFVYWVFALVGLSPAVFLVFLLYAPGPSPMSDPGFATAMLGISGLAASFFVIAICQATKEIVWESEPMGLHVRVHWPLFDRERFWNWYDVETIKAGSTNFAINHRSVEGLIVRLRNGKRVEFRHPRFLWDRETWDRIAGELRRRAPAGVLAKH